MSNWLSRLRSGWPGRRAEPAAPPAGGRASVPPSIPAVTGRDLPPAAATAASDEAHATQPPPVRSADFVDWMLGGQAVRSGSGELPGPAERQALQQIDALIAAEKPPTDWLTRAPAVIPQLLSMLRQDDLSMAALARHIQRDIVLTTEVLRVARSARYRTQTEVTDLAQALSLLGVVGVRSAIARVVLKPMFGAQQGTFTTRAAERLWDHAELKAQAAAQGAQAAGLDSFEGYLAGLVHNSGWSVIWRVFDKQVPGPVLPLSEACVDALVARRDALFGRLARAWQLTPLLDTLGRDALQPGGLAQAASPYAAVLLGADREATAQVMIAASTTSGAGRPPGPGPVSDGAGSAAAARMAQPATA